eukprot:XP_001693774.1 predicted protein [Chlamydomonas reinhardtii]
MALERVEVVVPETEAVAIEYPAFIRNSDRALATLGGLEGIAVAVDATDHLKLKHRPDDRTSHPLYGERSDQLRLLLRIARPRAQAAAAAAGTGVGAGGADCTGDGDGIRVSLAARVAPTFRFPGLADYAFLPTDPGLASRDRSAMPYEQRPDKAEPTRTLQPLLLIPQLFSWLDLPQDYAFKQVQAKTVSASKAPPPRVEPQWGESPHISFYAELLETEVWRLLSSRPVWGLELLRERWSPWRGLYIRRGYDPRAEVESRQYQAVIYSLPNNCFRALPTQQSSTFQLCDLQLPDVAAVLQTPPPGEDARCSEKTGWLTNAQLSAIQVRAAGLTHIATAAHASRATERKPEVKDPMGRCV